ncbi:MAG TPA: hypothetical protein VM844_03180 [Miltoncostaeaceae bacterium]|nr:hypothetical protein [Miltoncostaeaceae bacterium]
MSVAVVTCAAARDLDDDLPPLLAALGGAGIAHALLDWDDPGADWGAHQLLVVRSVWDYVHRRAEFLAWAEAAGAAAPLANPAPVLAWSSDKRYLADLAAAGVPVAPTAFAAPGEAMAWPDGTEVVVKPAVSAGSIDTERYPARSRADAAAHVARLHADGRVAMAQPYLARVDAAGETAMVFLDGRFSHAVRKGPMLRDEREVVGGLFLKEQIGPAAPTAAEAAVARAAMAAVPADGDLLYGRVDLIPGDDGAPVVIELELLEPSLFLAHVPGTAERLVGAIARRLTSAPG